MEVGCGGGGGYRDTLPLLFPPLRTQVQMEADALRFGRFPEGFIINFAQTEKSYHRMASKQKNLIIEWAQIERYCSKTL